MWWASFGGALAGTALSVLLLIGIVVVWDYVAEHRAQRKPGIERPRMFADILESHLEQYILERFQILFPGWQIYDEITESTGDSEPERKPSGVRYRTKAGEIDILCLDRKGNFVVIELKRGKAPDRVVAQVDRYVAWVKEHLAQPGQRVTGLIIARSFGDRLNYALSRRRGISIWTYDWQLKFNKRPRKPQAAAAVQG